MAISKEWALVRSWLRRTYNKDVHAYFRDLPEDADPDNSTGRSTTKAVCLIGANDSQNMAIIKRQNFEYIKSKVGYAPPTYDYAFITERFATGKPQVQLHFWEKYSTAKARGRQQARTFLSFRADGDWSTMAPANAMALKIRNELATPIYHYSKGELKFTYYDKQKGHDHRVLVPSITAAKELLGKLFDVMGQSPDWDFLTEAKKHKDLNTVKNVRVLGKTVKVGPQRPTTEVYFRHAVLFVPPYPNAYPLVDTTGDFWNAIYQEPNPFLATQGRTAYNRAPNLRLQP